MAIVTGLTAARMLAIEAASIVDGTVVGDNLILEKHDGSTIDAGSVRGPTGSTGSTGSTGPAGQNAAFLVKTSDPNTNLTLSGLQTFDGVACVAGDRILAKSQTTASQNGIWVVAAGAYTRAADADTAAELAGAIVEVQGGTIHGGQRFVTNFKSTDTLGTTAMNWRRMWDGFSAAIISFTGTTSVNGYLTVTHGLGWAPSFILVQNYDPGNFFPLSWGIDLPTSTDFRVRFMNAAGDGPAVSLAVGPAKAICFR